MRNKETHNNTPNVRGEGVHDNQALQKNQLPATLFLDYAKSRWKHTHMRPFETSYHLIPYAL